MEENEMHDVCEVRCVDEDKVNRLKSKVNESIGVAKIFKALADDTRAKIVYALALENELCVCDVANIIGHTVSATSHHLRLLKNMGLASSRKEGQLVYYALDDSHVKELIFAGVEHAQQNK